MLQCAALMWNWFECRIDSFCFIYFNERQQNIKIIIIIILKNMYVNELEALFYSVYTHLNLILNGLARKWKSSGTLNVFYNVW